jgi:hypothetical protein
LYTLFSPLADRTVLFAVVETDLPTLGVNPISAILPTAYQAGAQEAISFSPSLAFNPCPFHKATP